MDTTQRPFVMTYQNRPSPAVSCLRIWTIWGFLGGLALFVYGHVHPQFLDTLEGPAGPPAIDPSALPNPVKATEFFAAPEPPGGIPDPVLDAAKIPMKAVSLEYLKRQLQTVRSQLDLIRIFADGDLKDVEQLTGPRRVARMPRSAHSSSQEITMIKAELAGQQAQIQLPDFASHADDPKYLEALKGIAYDDEENYQADEPEPNFEAFESALHHIDEMSTCSTVQCRDPKPFVHFMKDPRDRNKVFIPQCTVLHRCMNFTGCCGDSGRECVPKRMTVIFKAFFIVNRAAGREGFVEYNPSMAAMIPLINHTACECREKPRLPKCTKNCPIPFRLMREGYNCTCNCYEKAYEDHWQCEGVKEGVEQLSQDGLICIKGGLCYPPQCAVGEFDVKKGYCPLSDKYSLKAYHFENPEDQRHHRKHLKNFNFKAMKAVSPGPSRYRVHTNAETAGTSSRRAMSAYLGHNTNGKRKRPLLPKPLRQALVDHIQKAKLNKKRVPKESKLSRKNVAQRKGNSHNVATRKASNHSRKPTAKSHFTHDKANKLEPSSKPSTAKARSQFPVEENNKGDRLGTSSSEVSRKSKVLGRRQQSKLLDVTGETTTRETQISPLKHSENNFRTEKHSKKHLHHGYGGRHRHHKVASSTQSSTKSEEHRQPSFGQRKNLRTQKTPSSSREAPIHTTSLPQADTFTLENTNISTTQDTPTTASRQTGMSTSPQHVGTTSTRTDTSVPHLISSSPTLRTENSTSQTNDTSTSQRLDMLTKNNKEVSGPEFKEIFTPQTKDTPQHKGISTTQHKDITTSHHKGISMTAHNDVFTQRHESSSTATSLGSSTISEFTSPATEHTGKGTTHKTVLSVLSSTRTSSHFNTPPTSVPKLKKGLQSKMEKISAMYHDDMPDMEPDWMSDSSSEHFMDDGSGENIERDD